MKTKLVDFDLAKAKDGAKVVTRDGERARIICYDKVELLWPDLILAIVD